MVWQFFIVNFDILSAKFHCFDFISQDFLSDLASSSYLFIAFAVSFPLVFCS